MATYKDFYTLSDGGFYRVAEFVINANKYSDFMHEISQLEADKEKIDLIKKESISYEIHTPTFGGEFPNGNPV